MAGEVFYPLNPWPTKDIYVFMAYDFTLITHQKRILESDLPQDIFLKEYEKVPGLKPNFEFKSKMQASTGYREPH